MRALTRPGAHRRLAAAAFVVPALVLTAACGDDGDDDATAEDTAEPVAEEPTATDETMAEMTDEATGEASGENLVTALEGCTATEGAVIGYSQPLPDPNYIAIEAAINAAIEPFGASLVPVNAQLDPGKQISDVQSLIQQQVDVVLINPVAPEPVFPAFDQLREAGIPIIAQDTDRGGPFTTIVRADNVFASERGAEVLAEQVGDGQVATVEGPAFAEVLALRAEVFNEAAAGLGLNVVDTQVNEQITPEAAREFADAWKQQYGGDLAGIWTFNDRTAVGVASAVDDTFAPVIVSMNGEPDAIPLVEAGVIHTTFDLQQEKIGQTMAYAALAALCDIEMPEDVTVPSLEVNAENVAEWRPLEERTSDPFVIAFEERDGRTYMVGD